MADNPVVDEMMKAREAYLKRRFPFHWNMGI